MISILHLRKMDGGLYYLRPCTDPMGSVRFVRVIVVSVCFSLLCPIYISFFFARISVSSSFDICSKGKVAAFGGQLTL